MRMEALSTAVALLGGQTALADAIGVRQQNVWNWLNRPGSLIQPEHCAAIEVATGKKVRRWHLRPDDWHRIWPELIGTKGAPSIAHRAAA